METSQAPPSPGVPLQLLMDPTVIIAIHEVRCEIRYAIEVMY